jgi:hypothetical protein
MIRVCDGVGFDINLSADHGHPGPLPAASRTVRPCIEINIIEAVDSYRAVFFFFFADM